MPSRSFPKDFLWGASTAAHQVEGNTHNQWSEWEKANAEGLAGIAQKRYGMFRNWPEIAPQATNPQNYISGNGVEHYTRYLEDFKLLKQLNLNAFRFSVEWSRLEPEEGEWDEQALQHYRGYLAELKKLHIEPVLTLWHWTVPIWFAEKGGFAKKQNITYFSRFVAKIAQAFGHDLHYVLTLNEPNVYTSISYYKGEWPPQVISKMTFLKVYWNLVQAHRQAYKILKQANPSLHVGLAMNMSYNLAKNKHDLLGNITAKVASYAWNYWFVNRTRKQQDFIGINFYNTNWFKGVKVANPKQPVNDMGWYMDPAGIEPVLKGAWKRYKLPLIITENGLADPKDHHRKWWLEETLSAMQRALENGVGLKGYLHWSLLDNFEWDSGWWPKFGLVEVNRQNMHRSLRKSATWFARYIAKQGQRKNSEELP